jgi:hypothetical protein
VLSRDGETTTTITLSESGESDEFRAADFMLSLLEASKSIEINAAKSEYELFSDNTKSFFSVLGEMKKDNKGFWWDYYVDFFYALTSENHVEAFSYFVSQSKEDEIINSWIKENDDKVEAMSKWFSNYNRN